MKTTTIKLHKTNKKSRKGLLFLFLLPMFIFAQEANYFEAITLKIQEELGARFSQEDILMKESKKYDTFHDLFSQTENIEASKKLTLKVLPYKRLFDVLIEMDKESSSVLPSLYAYNLMQLSYGVSSEEINKKYGYPFAKSLVLRNMCEGYMWSGEIFLQYPQTWIDARNHFGKAVGQCRGRHLSRRAALEWARIDYLIRNKKSNR